MGGEKVDKVTFFWVIQGSPPHGRGKAALASIVPNPARITPAWVGKRTAQAKAAELAKDHPRMGGEKVCTGNITN